MNHAARRFAPLAVCRSPAPACRPLSPAARLLVEHGIVFDIDGDHYTVDQHFEARTGPQADIIILHGVEYMNGPIRIVRRAIQVRDLERLINEDRVDIAFGPPARQFNRQARMRRRSRPRRGWPSAHTRGAAR
jgi:hypothetical protein